jgi:hypothetical protein
MNKIEVISIVFFCLKLASSITKQREYKFQVMKLWIGNRTSRRNYKLEPLEDAMNITMCKKNQQALYLKMLHRARHMEENKLQILSYKIDNWIAESIHYFEDRTLLIK